MSSVIFPFKRSGCSSSLPFSSSSISELLAMREDLSLSCHSLSASCILPFSPYHQHSIFHFSQYHTTLSLSFVFFIVFLFKEVFLSHFNPTPPPLRILSCNLFFLLRIVNVWLGQSCVFESILHLDWFVVCSVVTCFMGLWLRHIAVKYSKLKIRKDKTMYEGLTCRSQTKL